MGGAGIFRRLFTDVTATGGGGIHGWRFGRESLLSGEACRRAWVGSRNGEGAIFVAGDHWNTGGSDGSLERGQGAAFELVNVSLIRDRTEIVGMAHVPQVEGDGFGADDGDVGEVSSLV